MSTAEQRDRAAEHYDPAADNYDLTKDPRCLWGWGPPTCGCDFGHGCFRAYRHPGRCTDAGEPPRLPCETSQRPADWDTIGRAEANR